MEASATVFQLPSRRLLLIKCADWAGAAGTARDIVDVLVGSELQSPASSVATAEVLPPASDPGLSQLVQIQIASHVAVC